MACVLKRLFTAVAVACSLAVPAFAQDKGPLELTLGTDKTEYSPGSAVAFTLQFRNNTDDHTYVYLDKIYNSHLFVVKDSTGKVLDDEWTVIYDVVGTKENYHNIDAHSTLAWEIVADIKKGSGKELYLDFQDSRIKLPGTGEYTIAVKYEGWAGQTFGLTNIFAGQLITEPVVISIKEETNG